MAIRRCSGRRLILLALLKRYSPSRSISPLSGSSSPASMLTSVDLPLPDTPKMPTLSPLTVKSVDRVKPPKHFFTVMASSMSVPPRHFLSHHFMQKEHDHRYGNRNKAERERH